jgi:hypothetical protein
MHAMVSPLPLFAVALVLAIAVAVVGVCIANASASASTTDSLEAFAVASSSPELTKAGQLRSDPNLCTLWPSGYSFSAEGLVSHPTSTAADPKCVMLRGGLGLLKTSDPRSCEPHPDLPSVNWTNPLNAMDVKVSPDNVAGLDRCTVRFAPGATAAELEVIDAALSTAGAELRSDLQVVQDRLERTTASLVRTSGQLGDDSMAMTGVTGKLGEATAALDAAQAKQTQTQKALADKAQADRDAMLQAAASFQTQYSGMQQGFDAQLAAQQGASAQSRAAVAADASAALQRAQQLCQTQSQKMQADAQNEQQGLNAQIRDTQAACDAQLQQLQQAVNGAYQGCMQRRAEAAAAAERQRQAAIAAAQAAHAAAQAQAQAQAQQRAQQQAAAAAAAAAAATHGGYGRQNGTDYPYNDIAYWSGVSAEWCVNRCNENDACVGAQYGVSRNECWIKRALTGGYSHGDRVIYRRPDARWVVGNNGSVSCDFYCRGTGYGPWNSELPREWNGAKSVGQNGNQCLCKTTGTGWERGLGW